MPNSMSEIYLSVAKSARLALAASPAAAFNSILYHIEQAKEAEMPSVALNATEAVYSVLSDDPGGAPELLVHAALASSIVLGNRLELGELEPAMLEEQPSLAKQIIEYLNSDDGDSFVPKADAARTIDVLRREWDL